MDERAQQVMESGTRISIERDGLEYVAAVEVDEGLVHHRIGYILGEPCGWGRGGVVTDIDECERTGEAVDLCVSEVDAAKEQWRTDEREQQRSARDWAAEMRGGW